MPARPRRRTAHPAAERGLQAAGTQTLTAMARLAIPNFEPDFFQGLGVKLREDPFHKPYTQHPWVFACQQAIALPISQVPWVVMQEKRGPKLPLGQRAERIRKELPRLHADDIEQLASIESARDRAQAIRHAAPWLRLPALLRAVADAQAVETGPWVDLFRDVNPLMTRSQLWEATMVNLNGDGGECFWVLEGEGARILPGEVPQAIWPLHRHGWEPKINERTLLPDYWKYTTYGPNGVKREEKYTPDQLVRWRRYNPYDSLRGASPYDALKNELRVDHYAALFNEAFFKNGAQIGGWITFDRSLTPQQRKDFLQMLEARHAGARKAWRPGVLEGKADWKESNQSHRTMQFKELREWVRDACFTAYRVPKALVGAGSYDTMATAMAETRNFWETVLLPLVIYSEDLLGSDLFTLERTGGQRMWGMFDLSKVEALREDLGAKVDVAVKMAGLGYTADEVNERMELGMPDDKDWRKTWWRQSLLVDVQAPPPKPAPMPGTPGVPPPPGAKPPAPPPPPKKSAGEEGDDGYDDAPATFNLPPEGEERAKALSLAWYALLEREFRPGEELYERKLRSYLFALRNHQLDVIRQRGVQPGEGLVFEDRHWKGELRKRTTPVYDKVIRSGFQSAMAEIEARRQREERITVSDPEIEALIEELSVNVGRAVDTIRDRLVAAMNEVISRGGSIDELRQAVRQEFSDMSARGRITRITRTEVSYGVNGGRRLAAVRAGTRRRLWLTAQDELVRFNHVVYGEAGPQGAGFNYATLSGGGYTLEYPMDTRAPAGEVINCRCAELYLS